MVLILTSMVFICEFARRVRRDSMKSYELVKEVERDTYEASSLLHV